MENEYHRYLPCNGFMDLKLNQVDNQHQGKRPYGLVKLTTFKGKNWAGHGGYNLSTWEAEVGLLKIQGQTDLHTEF